MYDGSAVVDGLSLSQGTLSGENLLNNLMEVLTRFRLGKVACVADLYKCFLRLKYLLSNRICFGLCSAKITI